MNVIAKIICYFERSVVTLKLRKEYLNTVTYNIPVSLQIKCWTVWYIERYSTSTYAEVSNFQKKNSLVFLAHPVWIAQSAEPKKHKFALAKRNIKLQNPGLVTFYDIWPGNGVGLFLQLQSPIRVRSAKQDKVAECN